jgi:hypothetical protein
MLKRHRADKRTSSSFQRHRPSDAHRFLALHRIELLVDALHGVFDLRQQDIFERLGAPIRAPIFALEAVKVAGSHAELRGRPSQLIEGGSACSREVNGLSLVSQSILHFATLLRMAYGRERSGNPFSNSGRLPTRDHASSSLCDRGLRAHRSINCAQLPGAVPIVPVRHSYTKRSNPPLPALSHPRSAARLAQCW